MAKVPRKLRICCFGYNGVNNTGSEAKLLTTLKTIKDTFGDRIEELAVLTINKKNQKRYLADYPEIRLIEISPWVMFVHPTLLFERGFDIFILSEGSTFIDHFSSLFIWMFCAVARLEKLKGRKVVAYANDCGHLKSSCETPTPRPGLRNTALPPRSRSPRTAPTNIPCPPRNTGRTF